MDLARLNGLARDLVDDLEGRLALDPTLEAAASTARQIRDELARTDAAHLKALEEFVRDHPVGEPYDPDVYDVEK